MQADVDCGYVCNAEFTDALCPTQWVVAEGKLQLKGEIEAASKAEKLEWKPQEEQIDAFGNVVKIKVWVVTQTQQTVCAQSLVFSACVLCCGRMIIAMSF